MEFTLQTPIHDEQDRPHVYGSNQAGRTVLALHLADECRWEVQYTAGFRVEPRENCREQRG